MTVEGFVLAAMCAALAATFIYIFKKDRRENEPLIK